MTISLSITELLGSLLENRIFWENASVPSASPADAHTGFMKHAHGPSGAEEEEGGLRRSSNAAEPGHMTLAGSQVCAELVSKQLRHGGHMRKASKGALAAQLKSVLRKTSGPDGRMHLIFCGLQSAEVVQHAVESVGSAVQEYGIVQVLQTLELAKQLPSWCKPSAGVREVASWFWDFCLNATVVGQREAGGNMMQLKGLRGAMMMMTMSNTMGRVLPGVVEQLPAVADKLNSFQGMHGCFVESMEVALQCQSTLMDMVPVSFCCCNPDCTSLQGGGELY
jgi:hypothetical protein